MLTDIADKLENFYAFKTEHWESEGNEAFPGKNLFSIFSQVEVARQQRHQIISLFEQRCI